MESPITTSSSPTNPIRSIAADRGDVSFVELDEAPALLNIGCGEHFHPAWMNLDLVPQHPSIVTHDVKKSLPFADRKFDAVYHSHVLEHLPIEVGQYCIGECFRVLKPGGVLRIVVPDLERIVELYLETHIRAWKGDPNAREDYYWMKLELLDQMVRARSGGLMGQYMSNPGIKNREFVQSRVGHEFLNCDKTEEPATSRPTFEEARNLLSRISSATYQLRRKLAKRCVRILLGRDAKPALDEGLFRMQGEVHRWMYDRFSLRDACETAGFKEFRVVSATQSQIPGFEKFELDVMDGAVRKPDSLFVECRKSDE